MTWIDFLVLIWGYVIADIILSFFSFLCGVDAVGSLFRGPASTLPTANYTHLLSLIAFKNQLANIAC